MPRRLLPAVLVLSALLSDVGGAHGLALAFLLCAIPAAFVLVLDCYGDVLEARSGAVRPALAGLSLALLVLSAALRSPAVLGGVPTLAESVLVLALLLYSVVLLGGLLPGTRGVPESA
ncbi:MAG TPA: hypothetical protein VK613_06245 [Gaiellaceae bacterium]|nr:hypothetical protein [Gaiellaceae bacterium]